MTGSNPNPNPDIAALAAYQKSLAAYVLGQRAEEDITPAMEVGESGDAARLSVYRNTTRASLTDVLATAFPVVQALVGTAFFAGMARAFIAASPPTRPQLSTYGDGFAEFIAGFPPAASLPYLPDVARLEWARVTVYFAPESAPMVPEDLVARSEDDLAQTVLAPRPSVCLLATDHAAFSLHAAHGENGLEASGITPGQAEQGAIWRTPGPDGRVRTAKLAPALFAFLAVGAGGAPLADAAERALAVEADFDLQAALAFVLGEGLIWADRETVT